MAPIQKPAAPTLTAVEPAAPKKGKQAKPAKKTETQKLVGRFDFGNSTFAAIARDLTRWAAAVVEPQMKADISKAAHTLQAPELLAVRKLFEKLVSVGWEPPKVSGGGSSLRVGENVRIKPARLDWYTKAGILTAEEAADLRVCAVYDGGKLVKMTVGRSKEQVGPVRSYEVERVPA